MSLVGTNSTCEDRSLTGFSENESRHEARSKSSSSEDESLALRIHFDFSIASMEGRREGLGLRMALIRFLACLETLRAGLPLMELGKSKSAMVIL